MKIKAYELLSQQPNNVCEISNQEKNGIVISAVFDTTGKCHVLSNYGDPVWEMWPFYEQSNLPPSSKKITWKNIPEEFRDSCKAVVYRYWKVGLPGVRKPCAATLRRVVQYIGVFVRYLKSVGISSLDDVQSLHIFNYVHKKKEMNFVPSTLNHLFTSIEILHHFSDQHPRGMRFHPWPSSSASEMAGAVGLARKEAVKVGKTALIPTAISKKLFRYAEGILNIADSVLEKRDSDERSTYRRESPLIRDACFYLLGVLTGMRCEELIGIEIGAGRTEIKNGVTYHWIRSIEHKTFKGNVEYLMPEMGHRILRVLERWSTPLRERLRCQVAHWEADKSRSDMPERLERIATAKLDLRRLFLGDGGVTIRAISGTACGSVMRALAKRADVQWDLTPHQMRRLYAWTFVRHRLGNLLFLKDQFKHSTIDMSQLYAANPYQDPALYDEILYELHSQKTDLIQGWLFDEKPLAGGAGRKVMKLRAHSFPSRQSMIEDTANKLNVRSTGHGWCLSQDEGCGGAGLYEKTRCSDCGNGLIDLSFEPIWQEIYRHQIELVDEAKGLGKGAIDRVNRDLLKAKMVLMDLGVDIG